MPRPMHFCWHLKAPNEDLHSFYSTYETRSCENSVSGVTSTLIGPYFGFRGSNFEEILTLLYSAPPVPPGTRGDFKPLHSQIEPNHLPARAKTQTMVWHYDSPFTGTHLFFHTIGRFASHQKCASGAIKPRNQVMPKSVIFSEGFIIY